jgi:hypothetical protein
MRKIKKVNVNLSSIKSEEHLQMVQAACNDGAAILDSALSGFPLEPLPVKTEFEGPLRLVFWAGCLEAIVQSRCEEQALYLALDYCKNSGNPFRQHDATDYQETKYHLAPSGKTVTTDKLRLELVNLTNIAEVSAIITLRIEDYENPEYKPSGN